MEYSRCRILATIRWHKRKIIMTREELQNEFGDAVCVYCNKNIIPEHNLGIGCLCEGNWCEEAQDGYADENNIELED